MTRALIALQCLLLALYALPVRGEVIDLCPQPVYDFTYKPMMDQVHVEREPNGLRLEFFNRVTDHGGGVSNTCRRRLVIDEIEFFYVVDEGANPNGDERFAVEPPPGFVAYPPEVLIPDGPTGAVILLRQAMF